ncbi:unnamed protein product [Schistosoma margrebowiei]|uniref:ATP synthase subunit e, mitochondrial n=1 Tax=Schistosoma margrebowiei TaxID=48269 RepID=A0AA85AFX0_9TREM|nr:unnamed protein product [Schistosoma margrebowiei]
MWPLILQFIRTNVRYVALPFAVIVGSIGFKAESWFRSQEAISSSMHNPKQTTSEARRKRQLTKDLDIALNDLSVNSESELRYYNDPIFNKNK